MRRLPRAHAPSGLIRRGWPIRSMIYFAKSVELARDKEGDTDKEDKQDDERAADGEHRSGADGRFVVGGGIELELGVGGWLDGVEVRHADELAARG